MLTNNLPLLSSALGFFPPSVDFFDFLSTFGTGARSASDFGPKRSKIYNKFKIQWNYLHPVLNIPQMRSFGTLSTLGSWIGNCRKPENGCTFSVSTTITNRIIFIKQDYFSFLIL